MLSTSLGTGWSAIFGWLTQEEGAALQKLALGRKVLELGALCGRSTLCMAEVARLVVSVDWCRGDRDAGYRDTAVDFLEAVRDRDNVIPIITRFEKVGMVLSSHFFDMVFVDGQHDFHSVVRDTSIAIEAVGPDGVIVWHDHGDLHFPDVERAVVKLFPGRGIDDHVGSLAWRYVHEPSTAALP